MAPVTPGSQRRSWPTRARSSVMKGGTGMGPTLVPGSARPRARAARPAEHRGAREDREMATSVAEHLVRQLVGAGVSRIYGIVGDSLNPVVDAVRRTPGIDWVHVRHEEAAAFAAAGEAEVTGRLTACAGSCGPGNLHLINGLYDANRSRLPVLAIASHIPSNQIGTQFFQETHPDRLFTEASVFSELITTPAQLPRVTRSAIQHAVGTPGVAVLTLPGDVADAELDDDGQHLVPATGAATLVPAEEDVAALAEAINAARRVTLFVGAGARGARTEVLALAEQVGAPVGHRSEERRVGKAC